MSRENNIGNKQGVLFVSNFASNTGYAWNMIEDFFVGIAEAMSRKGIKTYVCYSDLSKGYPYKLNDKPIEVFNFDYSQKGIKNLVSFLKILHSKKIKVLYLIDKPTYAFRYLLFRLAGLRKIIVHDHTSGDKTVPRGIKWLVKKILHSLPYISVDYAIGVSKFVANRLIGINCIPHQKVRCIYNGVNLEEYCPGDDDSLYQILGVDKEKKIIFCSGRANYYKGIHILIEAAEELLIKRKRSDAVFAYCGDGPDLEDFKQMVSASEIQSKFFFLGKRDDVNRLLKSATAGVVPSIWEEAFCLTVIEAMASGIPVVASRVGGIPEIIDHKVNGYLFEPGNPLELANIMDEILDKEETRHDIGKRGRRHIEDHFSIKQSIKELQEVFLLLIDLQK